MQNIKDLTLTDIEKWLTLSGEKPYKALQVFAWTFNKGVSSFDEMTDISKELRETLKENFYISQPHILAKEKSSDGTQKLLLELEDKNRIECVLIPEEDRLTLCISSQFGCPLDCGFCMTGHGGFVRNLTLSEMIDQVFAARSIIESNPLSPTPLPSGERARVRGVPEQQITNLVLMGMGEPFLNYEEVIKFLTIATHHKGLGIASRRVTVSTAGIVPMMERLGQDAPKVNIAISLNATTDAVRSRIMPINKKYPLKTLLDACRKYPLGRNRRITFEYVLLKGVNDSLQDAERLVKMLKGIPCKINLIPFNPFPGAEFKRSSEDVIQRFQKFLLDHKYTSFIRTSKGQDISGACGQLRGKIAR